MISVKNAINLITSKATKLNDESISIDKCLGRVSSNDIFSNINNPPADVSSMDGYALNYKSLKNLKRTSIKIIGESSAGKPFYKPIKINECIALYTGAEIPKGADIILLQERVEINNDHIISTNQNYKKNQYIRKKGSNFKKGTVLLKKFNVISARALGLIVSSNKTHIRVLKKPKIAILASGNELRRAGSKSSTGIISSNTLLLKSVIESFGGESFDLGIAKDNSPSISKKLRDIKKYNILITTGGASVGKHDLIKEVLIKLGMKLIFWKVAMRPGKPLIFGKLKNTLILGFPGNPVSTYVSAIIFLKPLINSYYKIKINYNIKYGILEKSLIKNDERQEYLRSKVKYIDNNYYLNPIAFQDSSMTSSLSSADCLIIREPFARKLNKGNKVAFILFSDIHSSL
jgi:molybdopterin molybdotransferase